MALDGRANFKKVTLFGTHSSGATTINLQPGDGAEMPDPATVGPYNVTVYNATDYQDPADDPYVEVMRVTAKSSDQLTVARGQESSAGTAKDLIGRTYRLLLGISKKMIDDIEIGIVPHYGASAGSSNAFTATHPSVTPKAYFNGMGVLLRADRANTGAATLNVNGLGVKSIVRADTQGDLKANDILASDLMSLRYDSTLDKFVALQQLRMFFDYVKLQHTETASVAGGTSTAGAWTVRKLNTEAADTSGICSLASNQFTLSAGVYLIYAAQQLQTCQRTRTRIYNATAGAVVTDIGGSNLISQSDFVNSQDTGALIPLYGIFSIAAGQALQFEYHVQNGIVTNGLGVEKNQGTEVYAEVHLIRLRTA